MSIERDKVAQLIAEISNGELLMNKLGEKRQQLVEAKTVLIRQIIKEENLLNLCHWSICVRRNGRDIYLLAEYSEDSKTLSDLTASDYHFSFPLEENYEDGITDYGPSGSAVLSYIDGDIRIYFSGDIEPEAFISRYSLPIDTSYIDYKVKELEQNISTLLKLKGNII
jgi:hypothetical protein